MMTLIDIRDAMVAWAQARGLNHTATILPRIPELFGEKDDEERFGEGETPVNDGICLEIKVRSQSGFPYGISFWISAEGGYSEWTSWKGNGELLGVGDLPDFDSIGHIIETVDRKTSAFVGKIPFLPLMEKLLKGGGCSWEGYGSGINGELPPGVSSDDFEEWSFYEAADPKEEGWWVIVGISGKGQLATFRKRGEATSEGMSISGYASGLTDEESLREWLLGEIGHIPNIAKLLQNSI